MTEKEKTKDENLFLLYGSDRFKKVEARREVLKKFEHQKDVSFFNFEIDTENSLNILESALKEIGNQPLFAALRFFTLKFFIKPEAKGSKNGSEKSNPTSDFISKPRINKASEIILQKVMPLLEKLDSSTFVLLDLSFDLDEKNTLLLCAKKISAFSLISSFKKIRSARNSDFSLDKKINEMLRMPEMEKIDRFLVEKLKNGAGSNPDYIISALDEGMLLSKALPAENINSRLETVWNLKDEKTSFQLIDAVISGNLKESLSLFEQTSTESKLKGQDDTTFVLSFLGLLIFKIVRLLSLKEINSPAEAQSKLNIPPYFFSQEKQQSENYGLTSLLTLLKKTVALQQKAKSGLYSPLLILTPIIFSFSREKRKR